MDFDGNFRQLGRFDVTALRRFLAEQPEQAWSDEVASIAKVHRHSRGIFLKNDIKPEHLYGTVQSAAARFVPYLDEIIAALSEKFPESYLIRLQFSRHLPGFGFDPHHDKFSYTLCHSYRIHIPVLTNPKVWFSVGGEGRHLAEGEAWEINNVRVHAGANEGTGPRIHLIADFAMPLKTVADRIEYFMNLEKVSLRSGWLLCRPQLADEPAPQGAVTRDGEPPVYTGIASQGMVVAINYKVRDADTRRLLAADVSDEPTVLVPGYGQLPAALEKAIHGLKAGEPFSIEVPGALAYGEPGGIHPFAARRLIFEGKVVRIRALEPAEFRYAVYEGPTLT